VLSKGWRV